MSNSSIAAPDLKLPRGAKVKRYTRKLLRIARIAQQKRLARR
jgi:hypothetical protein